MGTVDSYVEVSLCGKKCEVIDDLGENNKLYNDAWDLVRAAQ